MQVLHSRCTAAAALIRKLVNFENPFSGYWTWISQKFHYFQQDHSLASCDTHTGIYE
ncbi:hypothetical protein Mapa_007407 [Marchantia paleacea]|nr:hypothetical protein Mapa_007407 [Marchantia paleacea]